MESDFDQAIRDTLPRVLAQLRHAYLHLTRHDERWSRRGMHEFANGLLAPQIRKLEDLAKLMDTETSLRRCASCVHLTPFELAPELNTCPVVNIRIHAESAAIFGCNQWELKPLSPLPPPPQETR